MFGPCYENFITQNTLTHGLRTPREEIAFTARPKIHSHSQIFRYGGSIFCLPHRPNFSDIFDLCLHWVSVVRVPNLLETWLLTLLFVLWVREFWLLYLLIFFVFLSMCKISESLSKLDIKHLMFCKMCKINVVQSCWNLHH